MRKQDCHWQFISMMLKIQVQCCKEKWFSVRHLCWHLTPREIAVIKLNQPGPQRLQSDGHYTFPALNGGDDWATLSSSLNREPDFLSAVWYFYTLGDVNPVINLLAV